MDDLNGFASEDSETRSAKRRVVGNKGRTHHASSGLSPLNGSTAGDEKDPGPSGIVPAVEPVRIPISRASSATTSTTAASALDDMSANEMEAPLSQDTRREEDDDYDDEEDDTRADGDTTIAAPPSPATTLTSMTVPTSSSTRTAGIAAEKREKQITRRERKKLGLPKARPRRVILKVNGQRPGSIQAPVAEPTPEEQVWARNGNGRMDVRGFRELKI